MVITRFAPSPTGSLHIGGLKMALYDFAIAKKNKGKFILRIEDTDQKRFVKGSEDEIITMLNAYNLPYDEIYRQSERLPIYKEYAEKLVELGAAYYCFTTINEIEIMRDKVEQGHQRFVFRSPYRDLPLEQARERIAKGESYVIRQKLPENLDVEFTDPVQGLMSFNTNDLDETVLLKSDGFPTYHLAATIDDHLMGITHVFRGVEWQPSVAKHVLIYKALGWEMPIISHLTVILDPEGGKLSKRHGSVSAKEFLDEGYLPEAILNFLMLLGWSTPTEHGYGEKEREIFSLDEFIELFDMKDVNKASPVFNREKLIWFNQKYIQALKGPELAKRFMDWFEKHPDFKDLSSKIEQRGPEYLEKILLLEQTRVKLLKDFTRVMNFFYEFKGNFDFSTVKQTKNLTPVQLVEFFKEFKNILEKFTDDINNFSHEIEEEFVRQYADGHQLKAGSLFMALRLAITDSEFSPPLLEVIKILGKDETIKRIASYIK